ncbi:MAG: bifunctional hydroxymethylpyrimidine kinase/phosphomethylpyrimidine kinase [Kiloniellales bacterium]|nr:bifunctional hydroxymethylpyrimidine kinase/phosphomethylpyrimidine kinase [Kiloniellales bacterium]
MMARVLIVAGSDSGGGAGIQADIKTVTALGGYAATAVTALTAQNTRGVTGVLPVEPAFIREQMERVIEDIGVDAVKTGMLHDSPVIEAVADVLAPLADQVPIVVDPVMVAQSGDSLITPEAVATLKRCLPVIATLLTPNIPEAERLTGLEIKTVDDMRKAAEMLLTTGCRNVLLKGGHLEGDTVVDVLATEDGLKLFEDARIETTSLHGTGCTLASATATGLAQQLPLRRAVMRARAYLREAIRTAPGLGGGSGPLNHGHTVQPFTV